MESENLSALADMYTMFVRIGRRGDLLSSFKSYVLVRIPLIIPHGLSDIRQLTARGIVTDQKRDEEMVERLLRFRAFAEKALENAFVDTLPDPSTSQKPTANKEFAYAMTDAFQSGFKSRRNKPAEMIAKYLDKAMRRGQKDASDGDFTAVLDKALELYRFTDDKDVFRRYYHRALAKRLLGARSASDASEISVLKRLKESEFDFTDVFGGWS
jgi:cullin-4